MSELVELMAMHGNLSRGLADTLTEITGKQVTQLALLSALSIEGIRLEIDTQDVASNSMDYATHLLHESRSEEEDA